MQFRRTSAVGFLVVGAAFAQILEDGLRLRIATFIIPCLLSRREFRGMFILSSTLA